MKNQIFLLPLMLCISNFASAQIGLFQKEINMQVWKPFIEAFNNQDNQAYSAVHSKDFIRVIRDSDQIFGYEEAFTEPEENEPSPWKRSIELRFIERIASHDKAFEVGYYQTSYTHQTTGEKRVSYGKFHVLLRKENDTWKILMDADGHEGTNEEIFKSADSLE